METLDRFRGVVSRKFRTDGNQFIEIETNSLEFLLFLSFFLSFSTSPLRTNKIDEGEGLLSLPLDPSSFNLLDFLAESRIGQRILNP